MLVQSIPVNQAVPVPDGMSPSPCGAIYAETCRLAIQASQDLIANCRRLLDGRS